MQDKVELVIDGRSFYSWSSYSIHASLWQPDGAFSFSCPTIGYEINEGMRCQVRVNGVLEITGIVEEVDESVSENESQIVVSGKDLMGILTTECSEVIGDHSYDDISSLAKTLLSKIPLVNNKIKDISYGKGVASAKAGAGVGSISAGETVFEVLRKAAESNGVLFYCKPDGSFVFGKPKTSGSPVFSIIRSPDGVSNNVKSGGRVRSIAKRYRTVKLIGQGGDGDNVLAVVTDKSFPLPHKTFMAAVNDESNSAQAQAKLIMSRQRMESERLKYVVQGHSQGLRNWAINEICRVDDYALDKPIHGSYLIFGRTFSMTESGGSTTELELGPLPV